MTSANLKVCLLIIEENKVLLIKEKSGKNDAYKWNVIKGTVDDENIMDAAIREAQEEANVKIELKESFGVHVKYYGENKYTVYFSFMAEVIKGKPKVTSSDEQAEGENISEVKWFTKEEIEKMDEDDFVLDISYLLVRKFLNDTKYPLDIITTHNLKSN